MRVAVNRRRWMRRIASLFLAFHVAAIVIAPASVEPTSAFWLSGWDIVKPYVQIVFLDQGWNFFSPEPGPSTLISYRAKTRAGDVVEQRLPNKEIRPRLRYHRHFMVTSYMGYQAEEGQEAICEGFLSHIKAKHDAEEIDLTKWVHLLPSQDHIRNGGSLDHVDLWEEHVFVEDELEAGQQQPGQPEQGQPEQGQPAQQEQTKPTLHPHEQSDDSPAEN